MPGLRYPRHMPLPPRDPRTLQETELAAWVQFLIETRTPEDNTLDYKLRLNLDDNRARLRVARAVSSFANERGGSVLFGVPEVRDAGVPVPRPVPECGLPIDRNLLDTLENVLLSTIAPPLPELVLRVLPLHEDGRQLLLAYHPASWSQPHMVSGYGHARYYRRRSFRSSPMSEVEVEAAYARRRSVALAAGDFVSSLPSIGSNRGLMRLAIIPHFACRSGGRCEAPNSETGFCRRWWLDAAERGDQASLAGVSMRTRRDRLVVGSSRSRFCTQALCLRHWTYSGASVRKKTLATALTSSCSPSWASCAACTQWMLPLGSWLDCN